MLGLGIGLQ